MQENLYVHPKTFSSLFVFLVASLCVTPLWAQGQFDTSFGYDNTDSHEVIESFDQITLIGYDATGQEFGRTKRQFAGNDVLISYEGSGVSVMAACSLETEVCVVSENGVVLDDAVLGPESSRLMNRLETQGKGLGLLPGFPIGGGIGLEVECETCWGTLTFTNEEGETVSIPVPYACNCEVKIKFDIGIEF